MLDVMLMVLSWQSEIVDNWIPSAALDGKVCSLLDWSIMMFN